MQIGACLRQGRRNALALRRPQSSISLDPLRRTARKPPPGRPRAPLEPLKAPSIASARPSSLSSEWVSLFNGKDLTGWKTHPSQPGNWSVNHGILVGSGPQVSHLYTRRGDYKGFHLRIEAHHSDRGSGAIIFRSGFGPERPKEGPRFPRRVSCDDQQHPQFPGKYRRDLHRRRARG